MSSKNVEILEIKQEVSNIDMYAKSKVMDYMNVGMHREIGRAIADKIAKGDSCFIAPLGIAQEKRDKYSPCYKTEVFTNRALFKSFPREDVPSVLAMEMFNLLFEEDVFIRVSPGFDARHLHRSPLPSPFMPKEDGLSYEECSVPLNPVYDPHSHTMIGMIGKCRECGKIYYAVTGEM